MKFLRVLPLSFAIAWRFLLVLPLWLIFYVFISLLAVHGIGLILGNIPIFGALLLPALVIVLAGILVVHPYLIGMQAGLRAMGYPTEWSQMKLMKSAVGYGLVEGIVALILVICISGIYAVISTFSFDVGSAIYARPDPDPLAGLARIMAGGSLSIIGVMTLFATLCVRALILPTLASAACGQDARGNPHGAMDSFGAGFVMVMAVLIFIAALMAFVLPFLGGAVTYIGLTEFLTSGLDRLLRFGTGVSLSDVSVRFIGTLLAAILVTVWLFSLQCAGAVLAFVGQAEKRPVAPQPAEPAADTPDIGELLRKRMPKPRG